MRRTVSPNQFFEKPRKLVAKNNGYRQRQKDPKTILVILSEHKQQYQQIEWYPGDHTGEEREKYVEEFRMIPVNRQE
jgi:hypothetical protein